MTERVKPRVKLIGKNGNAFFMMGTVGVALRKAGYSKEEIDQFFAEAETGDYDHLFRTCMKWCEVY